MTIIRTNADLVSVFSRALDRLGGLVFNNFDTMVKVTKAKNETAKAVKSYGELYKKISEQQCVRDENGRILTEVVEGMESYTYPDDEAKKRTQDLLKELNETEVELELDVLNLSELRDIGGLSPNIIQGLGDFVNYDE